MFPVNVPTARPATREALDAMIQKLETAFGKVRDKAFETFCSREGRFGSDLEDWFAAEREVFHLPPSEMKETEKEFRIQAAVPGFTPEQLHVKVLPELIVVEGLVEEKKQEPAPVAAETKTAEAKPVDEEKIVFSEFTSKRLFRQYKLPAVIDADNVKATLHKGMLNIVAQKAAPVPEKKSVEVKISTELVEAPPTALAATATAGGTSK